MSSNKIPSTQEIVRDDSREPLFGVLLLATLLLFTILSLAGVGWSAYSKWKTSREEAARPSISTLARQEESKKEEAGAEALSSADSAEEKRQEAAPVDKKTLEIAVLNGGVAKGSAAVAADLLKKEGYAKVTASNAQGDYAGVTVYFSVSLEKAAEAVKESLLKKYPAATAKAALVGNKETSAAPVTIIIGK